MGRANRGRDTGPELALRSELHRRGLRYRVQYRPSADLRLTIDVAFPRARVAVFVDGCFWHRCPEHGTLPQANSAFWRDKLDRNVARDRRADEELESRGWRVIRVWEHDEPIAAAAIVEAAVRQRTTGATTGS